MRVETQLLTGLGIGFVLLVGGLGLQRALRSHSVVAAMSPPRDSPVPPGNYDRVRGTLVTSAPIGEQLPDQSGTGGKSALDERDLMIRGSPLELMINTYTRPGSQEALAVHLLKQHDQILESPGDPAWSNDAERKLWEMIALSPEGPAFEVASITCRVAGCEVQVFVNAESASKAWVALKDDLAREIPGSVLTSSYHSHAGGRAMSVAFFKRDLAGKATAGEFSP